MTRNEAIERLAEADEGEEFDMDEEREIFVAIYERQPDSRDIRDGLISLCYADPDVAAAVSA